MRLNIYGIDIEVIRRRTRGVSMRIRPGTNAVSMSVPMRLPQKEIEEFAKKFIARIAKRQGQSIEEFAGGLKQNRQYSDGEKILIWGKEYTLRIKKVPKNDIPKIELKGNEALLYVPFCPPTTSEEPHEEENFLFDMSSAASAAEPSFSDRQYAFYSSIRKLLYEKIKEFLPKWEAKTGLKCRRWSIRNVSTYWGIYRKSGEEIDFNIHLAHKPPECLEFIILHELAHIRQQNHGPKFKAILDKYMPGWQETDKILKTRGG